MDSLTAETDANKHIVDNKLSYDDYINTPSYADSSETYQAIYSKKRGYLDAKNSVRGLFEEFETAKTSDPSLIFEEYVQNRDSDLENLGDNAYYQSGFSEVYQSGFTELQDKYNKQRLKEHKEQNIADNKQYLEDLLTSNADGAVAEIYDVQKNQNIPELAFEQSVVLPTAKKFADEGNLGKVEELLNFERGDKKALAQEVSEEGGNARKLLKIAEKNRDENSLKVSAEMEAGFKTMARHGDLDAATAQLAFEDGAITRSTYVSLLDKDIKAKEKNIDEAGQLYAASQSLHQGDGVFSTLPKEVREKSLSHALAKFEGNPEATFDLLNKNGLAHPEWKRHVQMGAGLFNTINISNEELPQQFTNSISTYKTVKANAPKTIERYIDKSQIKDFEGFIALTESGGMDDKQAIAHIQQVNSDPTQFRDNIKAKLVLEAAEDIADSDENQLQIANEVGQLANQLSYFMPAEDAIEKAKDTVEERKIQVGNFYIDRYSRNLPNENQLEAINEKYVADFIKQNKHTEYDDDEISFLPVPNTENGLWAMQHPNYGIVFDDTGNTKTYTTEEVLDTFSNHKEQDTIISSNKLRLKEYRRLFNNAKVTYYESEDDVILSNGETVGQAKKRVDELRKILKNSYSRKNILGK